MIDIMQYRSSIGLWQCRYHTFKSSSSCSRHSTTTNTTRSSSLGNVSITLTIVVSLSLLLILSGNVELNPGPKSADDVCKILKDVLRENFSALSEAIKACVPRTAELMYSHKLISEFTRDSKDCWSMIDEFDKAMLFHKESVSDLEGYCQSFLSCLSYQGGPPLVGAQKLAKEWSERVHQELNISLSFNVVMSDDDAVVVTLQIPSINGNVSKEVDTHHEVTLSLNEEEEIKGNLICLNKKFGKLQRELKNELRQAIAQGDIKLSDVIDSTKDFIKDIHNCDTIDNLLRDIDNSFDFLDCRVIVEIAEEFASHNLASNLHAYLKETEELRSSTYVRTLREQLHMIYKPHVHSPENAPKARIDLQTVWDSVNIDRLYMLMRKFFSRRVSQSLLKNIEITSSSVHIVYYMSESQHEIEEIIEYCNQNISIMRYIGIYGIEIDGRVLLGGQHEDEHFTFEYGLLNAAEDGNNEAVLFLIDLGIDTNCHSQKQETKSKGYTALMLSSQNGHSETVERLLEKADPNIQQEDGWTALMLSSQNGHSETVERLLEKADPNIQQEDGWTALMLSSQNGHSETVEQLLEKADPNIQQEDGWTALMLSSHNGHSETVERLLEKADPNIQQENGWTALMLSSQNGHSETVEQLLEKADPNIQNKHGFTALMLASKNGHSETVEQLLEKVDPNIQQENGWTALMLASQNGHSETVERLLEKADPNIQQEDGWTALMLASQNGHSETVERLLEKADPNIQNKRGFTALMLASKNGHSETVEQLLEKVDPNIQQENGWTALMLASQNGHSETVERLLEKADPNIQNKRGFTALMLSSQNGHSETIERLLEKADPNIQNKRGFTALMLSSQNGHSETVERLLEKADPNIQNKRRFTALMPLSSQNGHSETVERLLEKADPNIQNKHGVTALMLASQNGHSETVERLLEKADPNIQNKRGFTALMLSSQNGHSETVERLLEKADPNIQNEDGFTALFVISVFSPEVLKFSQTDDNRIHQCLTLHCIPILELLLDANSSPVVVSLSDGNNLSSLTVAAYTNNLDVVNVLIQRVDFSEDLLIHALITACYVGNPSVINVLLHKITDLPHKELLLSCAEGDLAAVISSIFELDVDPNIQLVRGLTPLMVASSCGHIELVDALIQVGADINLPNDYGNGVLDIVEYIRVPNQEVISTLVKYGATHINPVNIKMCHLLPNNHHPTSYTYEHQRQQPSLLSRLTDKYSPFAHFIPKAQEMNEENQSELDEEEYYI